MLNIEKDKQEVTHQGVLQGIVGKHIKELYDLGKYAYSSPFPPLQPIIINIIIATLCAKKDSMRLEMNLLSESTNNQKLMLEYEKHQELQLKLQSMQESYEERLYNLEDGHMRALEDMTKFYKAKLQEKVIELSQVRRNSHWGTLYFFVFSSSVCDHLFATPDHIHIIICFYYYFGFLKIHVLEIQTVKILFKKYIWDHIIYY